ncbi:hypothetical protein [Buttiauxella izardii]|uniref:Uncharacterized protein n=1 Tax=Buttiauxella izardii TaxID=82991 RepID=A0A3A5JTI7_9ENTR|nr:hypothetical protein [Buttiauxella izardii]RJT26058.1 hypothetical protein D6029_06705 [Buttiauxella izardii]
MSISFTDIDQQENELKKARAILSLLIDALPSDDDSEQAWALSAVFDVVHRVASQLNALSERDLKQKRAEKPGAAK